MWLSIETSGREPTEISVDLEPGTTAATLTKFLAEFLRTEDRADWLLYAPRLARTLDPGESLLQAGVCFGDRLDLVQPGPVGKRLSSGRRTGASLDLVVVGGPAAGQRFALTMGDHIVGRTADCGVRVEDPALSRQHFRIAVSNSGELTITDLGSANGTFLDGKELPGSTALPIGSIVEAGRSLIRVVASGTAIAPKGTDGRIRFNRPPRVRRPARNKQIVVPSPPARAEKPRLPWITALAPLAGGIGLVAVMRGQTVE